MTEETQITAREKADAPASLYAKMSLVMGRLERIPKNGYNAHFKYNFVTDADVLDAVRVAMAAEGMCLFISMDSVHQENKRTLINFQFTFADGESGQSISVDWTGEANDTQDKGIAKAATSALKYCLLKTFLIATGDAPDSDSDGPLPAKRQAARKSPGPPPAEKTGQATDKAAEPPKKVTRNGIDKLFAEVNMRLTANTFEPYASKENMITALKKLGHNSYNKANHATMVSQLVAEKEPNGKEAAQ